MSYKMLIDSKETHELLQNEPECFLLLSVIALRAKRTKEFSTIGLEVGEALISTREGMAKLTHQKCRTALNKLLAWGFLTQRITHKGTIVKIENTKIYDINEEKDNTQINTQLTHKQHTANTQPTTNQEVKKDNKEKNKILASNKGKPSSTSIQISFSFESEEFINITPDDILSFKNAYPAVDVIQQLRAMVQWLLSHPSRAPKTRFRAFITGWLARQQNQEANKSAINFQRDQKNNRRTLNLDGTPVENPMKGKF